MFFLQGKHVGANDFGPDVNKFSHLFHQVKHYVLVVAFKFCPLPEQSFLCSSYLCCGDEGPELAGRTPGFGFGSALKIEKSRRNPLRILNPNSLLQKIAG